MISQKEWIYVHLLLKVSVNKFHSRLLDYSNTIITMMENNIQKMPALFVGHGNPMNAIDDNKFTQTWQLIGESTPRPKAILSISAHWETQGTYFTAMQTPRTIHDFGGFPRALFNVEYPASGNPELASQISRTLKVQAAGLDETDWGLDHGTWSVLVHMFSQADIPVIQMSLNRNMTPRQHYELAKEMSYLREQGVLIMGSGNLVHNLREVDWQNPESAYDWAQDVDEKIKNSISNHKHDSLIDFRAEGPEFRLAIPTAEHYLPLLYVIGLQDDKDQVSFFNEEICMGSLSMTGVMLK